MGAEVTSGRKRSLNEAAKDTMTWLLQENENAGEQLRTDSNANINSGTFQFQYQLVMMVFRISDLTDFGR